MPSVPRDLATLWNTETFRQSGHELIDVLADYMDSAAHNADLPVLAPQDPRTKVSAWGYRLESSKPEDLVALLGRLVRESNHFHSPRYMGHQVPPPAPMTALSSMVSALLNQSSALYEMGPAVTAMESVVIQWMNCAIGFASPENNSADGFFTSGGSVGNLTALLAARQVKAGVDVWNEGSWGADSQALSILVSEHAHYSITRAARIMGWGKDGVISVPTNSAFQMRPEALSAALDRAKARGRRVIAVVASACSTATGSYDPIDAIADFCQHHDLWLHVDGAHGLPAALSPKYRALVRGIERADSVVWDAHKMMMMPSLATAVLFRNGRHVHKTFSQEAAYLSTDENRFNFFTRTVECTKPGMIVPLYMTLATHGTPVFTENVETLYDLARSMANSISDASDFELAVTPQANIVCFRYVGKAFQPTDAETPHLDKTQERIRQRIVDSGRFFLVKTTLPQGVYLRVTLMNPTTTIEHVHELLNAIRIAAKNP